MHLDRQCIVRWVVPIGAIAAVLLAATALPGIVLADTPTANPLDPIVEPPVDQGFNPAPLIAIAGLLIIVAGVIGAGVIVARMGGASREPSSGTGPTPQFLARSLVGRGIELSVAVLVLSIGAVLGYSAARSLDIGGFSAIGAAVIVLILGILIVGLLVPALVAWRIRRQMSLRSRRCWRLPGSFPLAPLPARPRSGSPASSESRSSCSHPGT